MKNSRYQELNREKANLPSAQNPCQVVRRTPQQMEPYLQTQSMNVERDNAREKNDTPQQLPPTHVPPLNAPAQSIFIPPSTHMAQGRFEKCVLWPICGKDARVCGGTSRETFNVYGIDGMKEHGAPVESELLHQTRIHSWSDKAQKQDCAWPCCGKAIYCGDFLKDDCSK